MRQYESHRDRRYASAFPRFASLRQHHHYPASSYGFLAAAKYGHPPGSKFSAHDEWISERVALHGEVTLGELCVGLADRGIEVQCATVGWFLHRLGLTIKKPRGKRAAQTGDRQGACHVDQPAKAVVQQRVVALIFIDETSTNTRLKKKHRMACQRRLLPRLGSLRKVEDADFHCWVTVP